MAEILKHDFGGSYSITFECDTPSDEVIENAGQIPNGYFWEGVAQLLVATEAQRISTKVDYDSEASMFCARSDDSEALDVLTALMTPVINDPERVTAVIASAAEMGLEFD